MGIDDIIELIMLVLFLVVSPLLERLRRKRAQQLGGPVETAPGEVGQGTPAPPAQDYGTYYARQLEGLRAHIQGRRQRLKESPVLALPRLGELAQRLVARAEEVLDRALRQIDAALAPDVPPLARPLELARASEAVRVDLLRGQWIEHIVAQLSEQRIDARLAPTLGRLDRVLGQLATRRAPDVAARDRVAFIWDDDPLVPGLWLGPGPAGLAPIPRGSLETASGWGTAAARAVGFDLLSQRPGAIEELRPALRVGPLAQRPPSRSTQATAELDLDAALAAWSANLAADVAATAQLGRPYALGLIHEAQRQGMAPAEAATIKTRDGRYDPEPPLLLRLIAVDEALDQIGWADADTGVEGLRNRIGWPAEAYYLMPNRVARRVMLAPLTAFFGQVAEALVAARLEAAGRRRVIELARSDLAPVDESGLEAIRRTYLGGRTPTGAPLHLLAGAILAESDPRADPGASYLQPFLTALEKPAPARAARAARGQLSDWALLREAMVLSEIL